ncbi:hypothetical protein [uncultured Roseivirga sp.]|uniref:hypothetical protein n=1 Tax=uncultured Roseivirga sp. TaxID=543088 RepID=UPI00258B574A|nr:hypothetical protein [uncultured Roseivirga sp.]
MRRQISFIAVLLFTSVFGFAQTVEDFKVKTLGAANNNYRKSPKRVLIADFQVQFQTALNLEDEKKGGKMWRKGIKGDAKAALTLILEGLEGDKLQALSDQLYEQYVADLKAQGFEIAPIEELWNHDVYAKNREKRWELKSGNGPEQGNEYGMILTRPSSQQFVVAQRQVNKEKGSPITQIGDYEASTERKLGLKKNDFIYNKVVIVVSAFDNALSETARALNRHTGYAQVKAETNFKIGEKSFNRFNLGTMVVSKGIEVADVLEKQKFDASQAAERDRNGTEIGILRVWEVENRADINAAIVKCDPDLYAKGTLLGAEAFLKATMQAMVDKSN